MSKPELKDIWSELETAAPEADGRLLRRVAPESRWDFWIVILQPGHRRCALMPLASAVLPESEALPKCRGIELRESPPLKGLSDISRVLELRLENQAYADIFDVLILDLIGAAEAEREEQAALNAALDRLFRWQTFLEKVPPDGLTSEAQRGLYGELLFLRDQLLPIIGAADSFRAWCGPKRKPQDFQLGSWAIEVKASIAKQPQTMRIASELQLDDSALDSLFLAQFALKDHVDGQESLPVIIAVLRTLAADAGVRMVFEALLLEAGYHDVHESRYADTGYSVRKLHLYRVSDGFPRIVESDLRTGVGGVSYSVGVADCESFLVDLRDMRGSIRVAP